MKNPVIRWVIFHNFQNYERNYPPSQPAFFGMINEAGVRQVTLACVFVPTGGRIPPPPWPASKRAGRGSLELPAGKLDVCHDYSIASTPLQGRNEATHDSE